MLVLVHPELTNDPANRQNQIGIISQANLGTDDIFVSFGGEQALYASDALLVFQPQDEIHSNLAQLAYETSFPILKALTQVDLFLRYGGESGAAKAMVIAQANPEIHELCLETLQEQIERNQSLGFECD